MDNKRKRHEDSDVEATSTSSQIVTPKKGKKHKQQKKHKNQKVETTPDSSEIELDDSEALVKPKKKRKKESDQDEMTALNKEKETPKKKVVEYECLFESKDSDMKNRQTIFVRGFDCSFPMDDIKSSLIKHFSSCGEVSRVFVPYECKTGSPLGFGFINLRKDAEKALALNGSYLGGMRLEVKMAIKSNAYCGYTNFRGCERCRNAVMKRRLKSFHESFRIRLPPGT